jgi:hypothetical protein
MHTTPRFRAESGSTACTEVRAENSADYLWNRVVQPLLVIGFIGQLRHREVPAPADRQQANSEAQ